MSSSTIVIHRSSVFRQARVADFLELTKPKISVLVLAAVGVAAFVASWGQPDPWVVLHALVGTWFVAGSASALNQWFERGRDALMERTADRPLPTRRLSGAQVLSFGGATVATGVSYLWLAVNWQAALWAALTWGIYVGIYTPLKSRTALNTAVGAVAGALPMLIGWSAVEGSLLGTSCSRVAALFFILFLWQFPHFMAIAWIYRQQYRRAGLKMLTVVDPTGRRAGVQAVLSALALLLVSLVPAVLTPGSGSSLYAVAAFVLGVAQLACAVGFLVRLDEPSARLLLRATLVYLPALLVLLMLIPWV